MTTIEHKELKGITVKNVVVTLISTASIVASVMTTYFGLKNDISEIKNEQAVETRINNIRLKILENEVAILQEQVNDQKPDKYKHASFLNSNQLFKNNGGSMLSSAKEK